MISFVGLIIYYLIEINNMKINLLKCFLPLLVMFACNNDNKDLDELGIYEIEIAQAGDYDKFKLHSTVSSENGDGSLIYSNDGLSKGVFYTLNEAENKEEIVRFYTGKRAYGLLFTCSTLNINEVKKDSMFLFIKGYYNGKIILEQYHTFYSYTSDELYPNIVTDNSVNIELRDFR